MRKRLKRYLIAAGLVCLVCTTVLLLHHSFASKTSDADDDLSISCSEDLGLLFADAGNGLEVLAVMDGSPANQAGIQPGDLLMTLDNEALDSIDELDSLICQRHGKDASVRLTLRRENGTHEAVISLCRRRGLNFFTGN